MFGVGPSGGFGTLNQMQPQKSYNPPGGAGIARVNPYDPNAPVGGGYAGGIGQTYQPSYGGSATDTNPPVMGSLAPGFNIQEMLQRMQMQNPMQQQVGQPLQQRIYQPLNYGSF